MATPTVAFRMRMRTMTPGSTHLLSALPSPLSSKKLIPSDTAAETRRI
jgi:hypothetical protein